MAEFSIAQYTLLTDRDATYTTGKIVHVVWESTFPAAVKTYLLDDPDDETPTLMDSGTGPSLGFANVDYIVQDFNYKFCSDETLIVFGTTLNYFILQPATFPYATRATIANSFACFVIPEPACDLALGDSPAITASSDQLTNDGAVTVLATSSNDSIKYGLTDFDYATEGQVSGTFENLYPGEYTIYAKDDAGCTDYITVIIPATDVYGVRYVCEWSDLLLKHDHKVEIEEQGYTGISETMKAGAIPATYRLNSDGEDRHTAVRASEFRLRVIVQTNFQYSGLYTEDSRKYRVKYYRDEGAGYVLKWLGHIDPFLYSESYIPTPYEIEITAKDGLADLKNIDFRDESGNDLYSRGTALSFISQILKKCDLDINIQSGINMYEDSMTTAATDDPLAQVQFNPMVYYNTDNIDENGNFESKDCAYVLENILKEFNATICQADAKWVIYRPEETIAAFDIREYDINGTYVSNGSLDPLVYIKNKSESTRLVWRERSGTMSMLPNYGKFIVRQVLNKKPSLLPSYSFEEWNIVPYEDGQFFEGWNIALLEGSFLTWGHELTNRGGDSEGCMYLNFGSHPVFGSAQPHIECAVYTLGYPIQFRGGDGIKFSFEYLIEAPQLLPWVTFQYKLKIGDYYLRKDGVWTGSDTGFVDIYTNNLNTWSSWSTVINSPNPGATPVDGTIEFILKLNNASYDGNLASPDYDETYLRAIPTTTEDEGLRKVAVIDIPISGGSTFRTFFYELETSIDADDAPDVVRPNDFNGSTNAKVWRAKGSVNGIAAKVHRILLDNAILEYLPEKAASPESQESIVTINPNNKRTLEVEVLQGDCPTNITNAKNTYDSYLTVADALSTSWTRDGFAEADFIQRILIRSLISQGQRSARRLNGNLLSDIYMKPYSCVVETMDSDRTYQTQGLEIEFKEITHSVDLYELKDVEASPDEGGGDPNPFSGAFDPQAFNISFD